jgi:hypothetical protein
MNQIDDETSYESFIKTFVVILHRREENVAENLSSAEED